MISLKEDIFLKFRRLDLIVFNNHIFPEGLHSVYLRCTFLLHEEHLSKAASSNDFLDLEILQSSISITFSGESGSMISGWIW